MLKHFANRDKLQVSINMGKTGLLLLERAPLLNLVLEHYKSSTLQPIVHKWVRKYPTEFCGNRIFQFIAFWKRTHGQPPQHLVFDSNSVSDN